MKQSRIRLTALTLAVAFCLALLPSPRGNIALAAGNYGQVTKNSVRVRTEPAGAFWLDEKLDAGYVVTITGTNEVEGTIWYAVEYDYTTADGQRLHRKGFIVESCLSRLTAEQAAAWEANPVQGSLNASAAATTTAATTTAATTTTTTTTTTAGTGAGAATAASGSNTPVSGATGTLSHSGVNLRGEPSKKAPSLLKLDRGMQVEVLSIPAGIGDDYWYEVRYGKIHGYIQSPYLTVTGYTVTAAATATAAPAQQGTAPTATPKPAATSGSSTGLYVKLILSSANLRATPGGVKEDEWQQTGGTLPVNGKSVSQGGYTWYPVQYKNHTYYVRGDCVQVVLADGTTPTPRPTATPNVTAAPAPGTATATPKPAATAQAKASYVRLVLSSANLRLTPGGLKDGEWTRTGETLPVNGTPVEKDGYTWYPVRYNNKTYYVRGDCVQVVAAGEAGTTSTVAPSSFGYVRTIVSSVNLRLKPAGELIQQIDLGVVMPQIGPTAQENGYTWYYVQTGNVRGYIRGDCVQVCNADGTAIAGGTTATTAPVGTGTTATTTSYGSIRLTKDKVNLRDRPAGDSIAQLAINTVLPMTASSLKSGAYVWYPVRTTDGKNGYIRGDCAVELGSAAATATPAAQQQTTESGTSSYGYVKITKAKTNLRKAAAGDVIGTLENNTVWPLFANATTAKGYTWYPVNIRGTLGYVRGDCAFKLSADQQEAYLASGTIPAGQTAPAATPAPVEVKYVQTTVDKVNLRASASKDAAAPYNVPVGTVMAYTTTRNVGGSLWYQVIYSNQNVWVLGSCVKVMTTAEYEAYIASKPAATPQAEVVTGYVKTTKNQVNIRATAGGKVIARVNKDVVMPYIGNPTITKTQTWYYVKTVSDGYGYILSTMVNTCNADGSDIAPATVAPGVTGPTTQQTATYPTLRRGSTGTAVKNLVTALKNKGYYNGNIISSYTTAVEDAVKAFQKANGLTVDGIAGASTQHTLFGTVPAGTADTSNLTMAIYPAEKIDWYTGGIQELWPKGANMKIYDVKTGIVWWAHRWSGGSHADIETLTAADTARLCRIYGVTDASKIPWQRRPCLITIGTRTFACSLYGTPHNYPEGDTIANNDMKGQICLHFTNSKTHGSNKVDSYHTEAIQYAWEHAPNGHK